MFLSKLESELFSYLPGKPQAYNLTKEEWLAMRSLAEDRDIIIKTADKGSCVVVCGREDYLAEGYKQLTDTSLTFKSRSTMINYYLNLQKRVTSFLNDYIIPS